VESVHYPGLETHPQHEIAKKQMKGFGGMLSFEVKGGEKGGQNVIENLEIIVLAVSLGGVVSLVEQASTMTHTMVPREERLAGGITDGLLRLSVGLEGPEDLIQDLNNALSLI
jgi:methionine-gamma-lyase